MTIPYSEPEFRKSAFNCPSCNAYARFNWANVFVIVENHRIPVNYKAAQCAHCDRWTLWAFKVDTLGGTHGTLVNPLKLTSPFPHKDLPKSCQSEYQEARQVFHFSPRAAAALLRLCIQKLCKELGEKGQNINTDIAALVKKGLDSRIQKALDVVRVTGNNAIHPGVMNLEDDTHKVNELFTMLNRIVEDMITKPKEIDQLYEQIPNTAKDQIKNRDTSK